MEKRENIVFHQNDLFAQCRTEWPSIITGSLEIQLNIFEECPLKNFKTTLTALILLVDMSPEPLFFVQ